MKNFLFLIAFVLFGASIGRATVTALHIHSLSRGVVTVVLTDNPSLTFNDDKSITVATTNPDSEPVTLLFNDIKKFEYGQPDDYINAVRDVTVEAPEAITVSFANGDVTFGNLPDDAIVEIYSLTGTPVVKTLPRSETWTLNRSTLNHGIYIVKIGNFSVKLSL